MYKLQMKTIFKILAAPFLWLLQSCSPLGTPVDEEKSNSHYYNTSKSQIRYSPMGNWFELGNSAMKADVESFEVFNRWLSKDKDHLFFESHIVENSTIDLATFHVKKGDYMGFTGFDKNFVYSFDKVFKNKSHKGVATKIEGADPKTFKRTTFQWGNDGKYHFYQDSRLNADFHSFEVLNDYFAKDKHRIFSRNNDKFEPLSAFVDSFQILDESAHGIDEQQLYWKPFFKNKHMGLITISYEKGNRESIKLLSRSFLQIGDSIYYDGLIRTDIDTISFEVIDHSYSKDANYVYYEGQIIEGADPMSFKKMENSYRYHDKNGTYHEGKRVEEKTQKSAIANKV